MSPDPSFGGDGFTVLSQGRGFAAAPIATQTDGKVVIGGQLTDRDGSSITVTRLLTTGAPDRCFGRPSCRGSGTVRVARGITYSGAALALQEDGKILMAGAIRNRRGRFGLGVVRLNADGTRDASFADDGTAVVTAPGCEHASAAAVAVGDDRSIVLAGTARCAGANRIAVAALDPGGAPIPSFGAGGLALLPPRSRGWDVAVQRDGKVVVAADWRINEERHRCLVARLDRRGRLDGSFAGDGVVTPSPRTCFYAYNVALLGDGRIVASGSGFTNQVVIEAARLRSDGTQDPSFGGGDGVVQMPNDGAGSQTMAVQVDGKLVFGSVHGTVARMNVDGSPDSSFGPAGVARFLVPGTDGYADSAVNGIAVAPAGGGIYVAGATIRGGRTPGGAAGGRSVGAVGGRRARTSLGARTYDLFVGALTNAPLAMEPAGIEPATS